MVQSVRPPLRVCFVVSYFHPFASGAERQALAQAVELVRRGHTVHVVTRSIPDYPIHEEEYQGVFIHRCIRTWDRGPLFGLSFVAGAVRALKGLRGGVDLIHTHQALWEAVATGLVRGLPRAAPTLVQPASSGFYGEADELRRTRGSAWLRRVIIRNTALAAISADIEQQWLALGFSQSRIARMSSGVDTGHFHPGPTQVEDQLLPRPRVVFTGRLHPQKNLPLLLEAWKDVSWQNPANLILIGPGSDRESLGRLADHLGIRDRVQFVGALADTADHLRAADLFVLPSVAEGMSNSLLEAMATALPCVVSGIGGNSDLVTDGVTGCLVRDASPRSWAAALLALLKNPEEARALGNEARRRIDRDYSLAVVVDRYLALYDAMITGAWPSAASLPWTAL
jgi:glycosyltransferase involved in cell wall biosynthesis